MDRKLLVGSWGCPVLTQKKSVATPKSVNRHCFFVFCLIFRFGFQNWQLFVCFFLALVLAKIRKWKLVFGFPYIYLVFWLFFDFLNFFLFFI